MTCGAARDGGKCGHCADGVVLGADLGQPLPFFNAQVSWYDGERVGAEWVESTSILERLLGPVGNCNLNIECSGPHRSQMAQ